MSEHLHNLWLSRSYLVRERQAHLDLSGDQGHDMFYYEEIGLSGLLALAPSKRFAGSRNLPAALSSNLVIRPS